MNFLRALFAMLFLLPGFALAQSASDFVNAIPIQNVRISPDGTKILAINLIEGEEIIVIRTLGSDAPPATVHLGREAHPLQVDWVNDQRIIATYEFISERDGSVTRETRLVSFKFDGTDIKGIVKPGRRISGPLTGDIVYPQQQHKIISLLPGDDEHILVSLDEHYDGWDEVRKVNVETGEHETILIGVEGILNWLVDENGKIRFGWGEVGYIDAVWGTMNMPRRTVYIDDTGRRSRLEFPIFLAGDQIPLGFDETGKNAYVLTPGENNRRALSLFNFENGSIGEAVFSIPNGEPEALVFAPGTNQVIGVKFITDRPKTAYFDPAWQARHDALSGMFPGDLIEFVSSNQAQTKHIVRVSGNSSPGDFYLFNQETNQLVSLAKANVKTFEVKAAMFKAGDGQMISSYLTSPDGEGPLPTVILLHDGPEGRASIEFNATAQFLASRGFLVVEPNVRGSTGFGEAFQNAAIRNWGGEPVDDVVDTARWLVKSGQADARNIYVMGSGFGGYAALMATIKAPDMFKGVIAINPQADLLGWVRQRAEYFGAREFLKRIGDERSDRERLRDSSPARRVEEIKVPVLLFQTRDNTFVNESFSKAFSRDLKKHGVLYNYDVLERGGHGVWNARAQLTILEKTEEFLRK